MGHADRKILILDPVRDSHIVKGFSSEIKSLILQALVSEELTINSLADTLTLPQSTIATNVIAMEKLGLITSKYVNTKKGKQKFCRAVYSEIVLHFDGVTQNAQKDVISVEMPVGLYMSVQATPPCGICSPEKIIGNLDSPAAFLDPERVKAGLLWFQSGSVNYQFPNNAFDSGGEIRKLEVICELSSEVPGTNPNWLSDITLDINHHEAAVWTSPGDFGDKRGRYTPDWWKLAGSQYGVQTVWSVTADGTYVNGDKLSTVSIDDLDINAHHSVWITFSVKKNAIHQGGINIFGSSFGNHEQDIILKIYR